mmetsp:Transcript_102101/g.312262  ORF Transcript_102101/g.312262 Transcript_102101/m.312262 type:complete len:217 (+) Transcript_102101:626-1276(+)
MHNVIRHMLVQGAVVGVHWAPVRCQLAFEEKRICVHIAIHDIRENPLNLANEVRAGLVSRAALLRVVALGLFHSFRVDGQRRDDVVLQDARPELVYFCHRLESGRPQHSPLLERAEARGHGGDDSRQQWQHDDDVSQNGVLAPGRDVGQSVGHSPKATARAEHGPHGREQGNEERKQHRHIEKDVGELPLLGGIQQQGLLLAPCSEDDIRFCTAEA